MANSASLTLDGTGDYASRNGTDDASLDLTGTTTVEAWIYASGYNHAEQVIYAKGVCWADEQDSPLGLYVAWNNIQASYRNGWSTYYHFYDISGLSTSAWHHVAATVESQVIRIYVDGTLVATSGSLGANPVANSQTAAVGVAFTAGSAKSSSCWSGLLDEVRVWNVRRGDTDVSNYRDTQASGSETGLVACWHFNSSVADATSNAFNLTLAGNATYDTSIYPTLTDAGGGGGPTVKTLAALGVG